MESSKVTHLEDGLIRISSLEYPPKGKLQIQGPVQVAVEPGEMCSIGAFVLCFFISTGRIFFLMWRHFHSFICLHHLP